MNAQTARSRALATQDAQIASNVAKIEEAKARPSALEALAGRLNVSAQTLTNTLKNTVFKGASNEEFVSLVIVANAYNLNPMLKEIFAFPAKGGGIIPVVSVDGWIRIINEHPQFDGIEFNDIVDEAGNLYAIESVIYRRDRNRPIKVTEYMDECKGAGPAWQKTPKRMLRHRALIQGGRVAFGFSGIYVEDEAQTFIGTVQQDGGESARPIPTRQQIAQDEDDGEDEETARRLDAEIYDGREGRPDADRGEGHNLSADELIDHIARKTTVIDVNSLVGSWSDAIADAQRIRIAEIKG
jgi:phage recombination protein Bet